MSRRWIHVSLIGLLTAFTAFAQVEVTDATIEEGQTFTMTTDNEYVIDGFVFVEEGAVLIIEPGTVIRGRQLPTTGDNASALIIARGGKIYANGTANNPIIFTAEADNLNDANDLIWSDRGLWGGIILLGRATTNRGVGGQIEGIPSGESRAAYGGDDDGDDSGLMRYVSIRHGGAELGPGDEINGLTFGAVGSRTLIEYVEVYANLDDGFEWFGGTVNTRNLIAAFCGDDSYDYDEGWRGKNQFWFAIQDTGNAGRIGEHDGGTIQETAPPFATPHILNATYIGPGVANIPQGDGSEALIFRDNAGGRYTNSIITDYNGANDGKGIAVEDLDGEGDDSRARLENNDLLISNNIWWQFGNGNTLEAISDQDFVREHLAENGNRIVNPLLRSVSRDADGGLDPRPAATAAASGATINIDPHFENVAYFGAFDPQAPLWINGWTALADEGHLAPAEKRWLAHVTRANGGFQTEIRFRNKGGQAAAMKLQPYDAAGNALTERNVNISGGTTHAYNSTELFGGEDVSHFSIYGPPYCSVTASYRIAEGAGASAELGETSTPGTRWAIYQGEWDVVFDGLALVNIGGSAASVTVSQVDETGDASTVLTENLAPGAKLLAVFDASFESKPGSLIIVESSQPGVPVFLRGTRPGTSPGYLYVTVPLD